MGKLTEEQILELRRCILTVWNEFGSDYMDLDERILSVSRNEVAQVCLDADRWRKTSCPNMEEIIDTLREIGWNSKSWKEEIERALPMKYYGV